MSESTKTIAVRSESHSDVAETAAARAYQSAQTEPRLAEQIILRLRGTDTGLILRNLQEEWVPVDGGLVHQLSVEAEPTE